MNLGSILLLARVAAWRSLSGKRGVSLVLLAFVPALILHLLGIPWESAIAEGRPRELVLFEAVMGLLVVLFSFVLPFAALFLGVSVLGDEIEGRTITYLYTRPVARQAAYLARLFGSLAGFAVPLAVSTWFAMRPMVAQFDLGPREVRGTIACVTIGLFVYGAIFAVLRALFKHALFVGFILAFLVEGVLSKLPVTSVSSCSVWHHLAVVQVRIFDVGPAFFEDFKALDPAETATRSLWILGSVFTVSCVLGALLVRYREVRLPAAVA
jgi:hypothetical protein